MSARRPAVKPVTAMALVHEDAALLLEHDLLTGEGFALSRAAKLRYSKHMVTLALIWVRPGARHEVALQFRRETCPDFRAADFRPGEHPHQRILNHFETLDFGLAAPHPGPLPHLPGRSLPAKAGGERANAQRSA